MPSKQTILVDDRQVAVTNLDKVFYPSCGYTKGGVIDYYIRIAPFLLPHLKGRPLTLKRYPDGVEGKFFYEKQCPPHAPLWIHTIAVKRNDGTKIRYCMLNDLPSLVWAANLANLEIHPFQHQSKAMKRPTTMIFDLDPGKPAGIVECCRVALWIRDMLLSCGLRSLLKTSGSKGLQVVIPLNTPVTYDRTKSFARMIAETLEGRFPDKVTSRMTKALRPGKVFIDWSQNDDKKTTVSVYSLRATASPQVSTPIMWGEAESAVRTSRASILAFDIASVLSRTARDGDIFEEALTLTQMLPVIKTLKCTTP